jgi:uncharacterized protein (DUF169 family)
MDRHNQLAGELSSALNLALPPIAVSFPDAPPDNVPRFDGVVPAGCAFWQQAATRTFITSAKDHALCSIGVHTHHLAKPVPAHQTELAEALKAMSGLDYVRAEEAAAIPVIKREVEHVMYGPLAAFPTDPEVVLIFAHARQSLIVSEAVARVDNATAPAMGRPACAAVPQALNGGNAALSLGCCGARAYLDALNDSVAMWVLPGAKLDRYCVEISTLARANEVLTTFHRRRREDVEEGKQPTVRESLERLSS